METAAYSLSCRRRCLHAFFVHSRPTYRSVACRLTLRLLELSSPSQTGRRTQSMKTICVLRHAKSRWDDSNLADCDRPLNERGWAAARKIGLELKRLGLQVDLVLASSAVRVRETIKAIEEAFPFSAPVRFEQALYLADERLLLDCVNELAEDI